MGALAQTVFAVLGTVVRPIRMQLVALRWRVFFGGRYGNDLSGEMRAMPFPQVLPNQRELTQLYNPKAADHNVLKMRKTASEDYIVRRSMTQTTPFPSPPLS